jgi:hypothetical protein
VIWVFDFLMNNSGKPVMQEVPNATATINDYAADGWEVHSVVPGTNAQTYTGLFITLVRD